MADPSTPGTPGKPRSTRVTAASPLSGKGSRAILNQRGGSSASLGSPGGRGSMVGSTSSIMMKSKKETRITSDIAAARNKILDDAEEAWNAVGSKLTVSHGFGCVVLPADPLLSFPGPPNDASDKDFSDRVIYSVGAQICIADADTGKQVFAAQRSRAVVAVLHVAIDATNTHVSICESVHRSDAPSLENECQLSIFKIEGLKFQTSLRFTSTHANAEFVMSSFVGSWNSQLIAALVSEPDRRLVVFNWNKEKVVRVANPPTPVSRMHCPSVSSVMITTSGPAGGIRCWYPTGPDKDSQMLKALSLLPPKEAASHDNFIDHCWLVSGNGIHKMVALGEVTCPYNPALGPPGSAPRSASGQKTNVQSVFVFEGGNAPAHTGQGASQTPPVILVFRQQIDIKLEGTTADEKIYSVTPSAKGFVLLGFKGFIAHYERTDDKREPYIAVSRYRVGDITLVGGCVLPSQERLVAVSPAGRLISAPVELSIEALKNEPTAEAVEAAGVGALVASGAGDFTAGGFHAGPIIAASAAKERPVIATVCSDDNSCRIWNYQTKKCEAVYYFGTDDPLSVAFHNNGFQLLVSFKDRVRMYNVVIGSLKLFKETILKSCREIAFSNGGQYWAGASAINLVVYDTVSFQCLATCQGHMMPIKRVSWAQGDQIVFSAAVDGTVYGWPVNGAPRIDVVAANQRSSAILGLDVDTSSMAFPPPPPEEESGLGGLDAATGVGMPAAPKVPPPAESSYCVVSTADGHIKLSPWDKALVTASSAQGSGGNGGSGGGNIDGAGPDSGNGNGSNAANPPGSEVVKAALTDTQYIWGDDDQALNCVLLSRSRRLLFAGTKTGALRVYSWPPVGPKATGLYIELQLHGAAIVALAESPQGDMLLSAGEDGCVFVTAMTKAPWTLKPMTPYEILLARNGGVDPNDKPNDKTKKFALSVAGGASTKAAAPAAGSSSSSSALDDLADDPIPFNSEVLLLSVEAVEEHVAEVAGLQKQLVNAISTSEYKTAQMESEYAAEMKHLQQRQEQKLTEERERLEKLRDGYEKKVRELLAAFESKEADGLRTVAELENRYEHKLAEQLDRYDRLAEDMEQLRQKCEALLKAERSDFTKQLNDLRNETRLREKKMRSENRRIFDDRASDESAFKEILNQQETEYEEELRQLIGAAETELISERDNIAKLRTLVQTKNTKLDQLKKKLIELSYASKARLTLLNNEKKEKQKALDTIEHYKRNLKEREVALAEKEKIISELRTSTRTLENFRFVLDYRLQQLSAERGPITSHIEGLERHVTTMYEELVEEFEHRKSQAVHDEQKDQKMATFAKDIQKAKNALISKERYIAAFKRELNNIVSAAISGKELEESIRLMYRKYVKGENIGDSTIKVSEAALEEARDLRNIEPDDDLSSVGSAAWHGHGGGGGARGGGTGFKLEVEEALIDSAKESERQKEFVSRGVASLQMRLAQTQKEATIVARRRLNENSNLLFEVNDLRTLNKRLSATLTLKNEELKEKDVHIHRLGEKVKTLGGRGASYVMSAHELGLTQAFTDNSSWHRGPHPQIGERSEGGGAFSASAVPGASPAGAAAITDTLTREGTPGQWNSSRPGSSSGAAGGAAPAGSAPGTAPGSAPGTADGNKLGTVGIAKRTLSTVGIGLDGRKWLKSASTGALLPGGAMLEASGGAAGLLGSGASVASSQGMASVHGQPPPLNNQRGGSPRMGMGLAGAAAGQSSAVQMQDSSAGIGADGAAFASGMLDQASYEQQLLMGAGGGKKQLKSINVTLPSSSDVLGAGGKSTGSALRHPLERMVDRLKSETSMLAQQLDDVVRERDNQRVENTQLRKQIRVLTSTRGGDGDALVGGTHSASHNTSLVGGGGGGYTDDNFDLESDAAAGSLVISGREERLQVHKKLTSADRTGKPSSKDLKDLALGPAPAIKSKPSRAPKGSNAKKTHGVVGLPPLPGSLQADSSIITDDGGGDRDYDREGEEGEAASPNVRFDDEEG